MARIAHAEELYLLAQRFCRTCIDEDGSLLFADIVVWTLPNLERLQSLLVNSRDVSKRSFIEKFRDQIGTAGPDIIQLAAEVLLVYFLFPSPSSISGDTKRGTVNEVLGFCSKRIDNDHPAMKALDRGIGGTGQGYNSRRIIELLFIIELAIKLKILNKEERQTLFARPWKLRDFIDGIDDGGSRQFRHMILHLLFPDHFERIASGAHKGMIQSAFQSLAADDNVDRDEQLYTIRQRLSEIFPDKVLDFYKQPLSLGWDSGEDDDEGIPDLDLLLYKKQIVFYGPPGTGKTHRAKQLARRIIHAQALRKLRAGRYFSNQAAIDAAVDARICRVQLHPGYGYEEFIRGLHIGEGGKTEYRPGTLLRLIAKIEDERKSDTLLAALPHVLLLDEMNRTDVTRLLGEAFSALEDRSEPIVLPGRDDHGAPLMLKLPEDLFVIGTMNLIDQSIEQVDFALRRRFLWRHCGFDRQSLINVCKARWEKDIVKPHTFDAVRKDFERLGDAAKALNKAIHDSPLLGEQYEIGHTYFFDVVEFLRRELAGARGKRSGYLWKKNEPETAIRELWNLSLEPLLKEYLRGLAAKESSSELERLRKTFFELPQADQSR